jgi:hypothetical protein
MLPGTFINNLKNFLQPLTFCFEDEFTPVAYYLRQSGGKA